ncbi:chondroadherin-like [Ambystoma mexicanum]|uniref:chondroadherin-like n=1 Tax=Ambystoma mexicanum TaxID=8296 RepID=UPI0037E73389
MGGKQGPQHPRTPRRRFDIMSRYWTFLLVLVRVILPLKAEETSACPANCACLEPQHHILCSNASLTSVPSILAEGTLELRLDYNNLTSLDTGAFLGLSQLSALHLSYCGLRNIQPGTFEDLHSLEYLHLDNNLLESLEEGTFRNLSRLLYLHLENNKLNFLGPDVFQPMHKLSALYLSHNLLTELSNQTFNDLPQLRWLYLNNNLLSNISIKAFAGPRRLRKLSLEANNLTSVPRALRQASSLQSLRLSSNPIRQLGSFGRKLRSLTELYLDELGLQEVSSTSFAGMRRLRTLSLRGNQLEILSLPLLGAQTELLLSRNPWRCDCRLLWLYVHLQVMKSKVSQGEALCSTPTALAGQRLLNVELQKLTCPAFGSHLTTAAPYKVPTYSATTAKRTPPQVMETPKTTTRTTIVSLATKATQPPPVQHPVPASNAVPERWDPCLAELISKVAVRPKGEGALMVTWSTIGERDQVEVRYSTGEAVQVLWVTGELAEVELNQLHMDTDYKVCIIPLSKHVAQCTNPNPTQCAMSHTSGWSGHIQPVHMQPTPSHSALGTGVAVAVLILVLVALVLAGAYKLRSRQAGFQRHFDEDGFESERYNPDPYKLDGVYESIEEDRKIFVTAASQWSTEDEDKLDCRLATSPTVLSTPRYVTL